MNSKSYIDISATKKWSKAEVNAIKANTPNNWVGDKLSIFEKTSSTCYGSSEGVKALKLGSYVCKNGNKTNIYAGFRQGQIILLACNAADNNRILGL